MSLEKSINEIMNRLEKNLSEAITKSFNNLDLDFDEAVKHSIQKVREQELSEKRNLLESALEQKQVLLLDDAFRRTGKSTLCLHYAKKRSAWLVRHTCFNHTEPNPIPGQFWMGSIKQIPRGMDKDSLIIIDDISINELLELYIKGYKNISGFARKY